MKNLLLLILLFTATGAGAQRIDSIYVNLYTDSLKKGTYNYINIDGRLENGHYLPLDSTHLIFSSSHGSFTGNSLWLDQHFNGAKVVVKVILRKNPAVFKEFDIYIKTIPDNEKLKTAEELLNEMKDRKPSRRGGNRS